MFGVEFLHGGSPVGFGGICCLLFVVCCFATFVLLVCVVGLCCFVLFYVLVAFWLI